MSSQVFRTAVIGAGINGLCAARALLRSGAGPVVILEQFTLGHDRGSSHGKSRITRSSYHSPVYIDLVQTAHREEWPALERDAGERLLHPSPGCFFGPPGDLYRDFVDAVTRAGADVEVISPREARRRFPQFTFHDAEGALDDRTAALIAAEATIASLIRFAARGGAELREDTRVSAIHLEDPLRIETGDGDVLAESVIVTAGPWAGILLPELAPRLVPTRQTVAYFELEGDPKSFGLGAFPVWAYLGPGRNGMLYGLPQFGRPGIKAARHVVSESPHDPDLAADEPDPEALEDLDRFVRDQFAAPLVRRLAHEHCFYTNTPTEDFVLDLHPHDPRVVIGAGFSGHGFKFGPVTGRILADLALHGRCDLPAYTRHRKTFAAGGPG